MNKEFNLGPDTEDRGLTKEQFNEAKRELHILTSEYINTLANKPLRLFYIFENHEQQQHALELLKNSEFYDELRQIFTSGTDPERPEVGIRMDFKKTPEGFEEKLNTLFAQSGIKTTEKYYQEIEDKNTPFKQIPTTIIQEQSNLFTMPNIPKEKPENKNLPKAA